MTREELNQKKQEAIINEQRKEKTKAVVVSFFKVSFLLIVGFLVFYIYTTFISTSKLSVKEQRILSEKIASNFDGLKVIHFSDLHYGSTVFYDKLKNLVHQINIRTPDLVVFTGDLIDINYELTTEEQEKIINLLKKIDSKLGKYAVTGEEDGDLFDTIMKQSDFVVLNNDYELIYDNSNVPILLVGLGSDLNNDLNVDNAYSYFNDSTHNSNIFSISLLHEPDTVDKIPTKYHSDLFLSGHSHNGTVILPFIGPIYKVDGAKKYNQEFYNIGAAKLFVSSGIGTTKPGFRLFCRPSFNFFRISKK